MVKRIIAGILILLASITGLLFAYMDFQIAKDPPEYMGPRYYQQQALITLVLSIMGFFGAYFAILGQSQALSILCTIPVFLALPVLSLGFAFALVGLVLLILSKKEFELERETEGVLTGLAT